MAAKHLVLSGNIGVGKTSLATYLQEAWGWVVVAEPFAENPFLEPFYRDMKRWAFHSQMFFLNARIKQQTGLVVSQGILQDRCLYEDAIFARNLYQEGQLSAEEFEVYSELFEALAMRLPPPDLIIYLHASVPVLQNRIAQRGREFEKTISAEYLATLGALYDSWAANLKHCPIKRIDTDDLDFVADPMARRTLIDSIEVFLNEYR